MPKVGGKTFSYSPEGIAKARKESISTKRPVQPQKNAGGDPNANAVNNFMNKEAVNNINGPMAPRRDVARLQNGINRMNRGKLEPLAVDGIYGPKTMNAAETFMPGALNRKSKPSGPNLNHRKFPNRRPGMGDAPNSRGVASPKRTAKKVNRNRSY